MVGRNALTGPLTTEVEAGGKSSRTLAGRKKRESERERMAETTMRIGCAGLCAMPSSPEPSDLWGTLESLAMVHR